MKTTIKKNGYESLTVSRDGDDVSISVRSFGNIESIQIPLSQLTEALDDLQNTEPWEDADFIKFTSTVPGMTHRAMRSHLNDDNGDPTWLLSGSASWRASDIKKKFESKDWTLVWYGNAED